MTVEDRLAAHLARLRPGDLDQAAVDAAGALFLDTLGAVLSGFANAECRGIAAKLHGADTGRCTVTGRAEGASAGTAALVNALFAHWCEWDDVHDAAGIHGSAVIYPALMAAAEDGNLADRPDAGEEFVATVVAAYDVAARVGRVMNANSFHGWMTTGAAASVAAAGGAARLYGLNEAGILSAMGIAAAGGGLSRQSLADRVNGKNALCALAAKNAVDAARMAAAGIVGAPNFFAGAYGLSALHAAGKADLAPLLDDLGQRFAIVEAGTKPYPCCRSTHASIDLVLDLIAERPGVGEKVDSILFTVPDLPLALCGRPFAPGENPRVSAQFSIPFTVALALVRGAIMPEDFLSENVVDFARANGRLIESIAVEAALPGIGGQATVPVLARVQLRDGTVIERTAKIIKGSPGRPMTPLEQENKLGKRRILRTLPGGHKKTSRCRRRTARPWAGSRGGHPAPG
jgi:2-methylcitrate dehydratase PrpD